MSAPKSSAVVMPTKGGEAVPSEAAAVTKMAGGGLVLSPLPLSGGRKRKTKRISKKVLKMFKKGSAKKLAKMLKGGQEAEAEVAAPEMGEATEGARRKRKGGKTRRGSRKSRHSFLY